MSPPQLKTCDSSVLTSRGRVRVNPAVLIFTVGRRGGNYLLAPVREINTCRNHSWVSKWDAIDGIMSFMMCFSAWSSGCGRNRCVPHVTSMCPCRSPSTGHRPASKSHKGPASALAMPAYSYDPLTTTYSVLLLGLLGVFQCQGRLVGTQWELMRKIVFGPTRFTVCDVVGMFWTKHNCKFNAY